MNTLVEQMLVAQHRNDLELEILEQTFEYEAQCQCVNHETRQCSVSAVSVLSFACEPGNNPLACSSVVQDISVFSKNRDTCLDCGELIEKCWTIRPI